MGEGARRPPGGSQEAAGGAQGGRGGQETPGGTAKSIIITVDFLHLRSEKVGNSNICREALQKKSAYETARILTVDFCNTSSEIL